MRLDQIEQRLEQVDTRLDEQGKMARDAQRTAHRMERPRQSTCVGGACPSIFIAGEAVRMSVTDTMGPMFIVVTPISASAPRSLLLSVGPARAQPLRDAIAVFKRKTL